MAEIVTIVGGQKATLNINVKDVQAAQDALLKLATDLGYATGNVLKGVNNLPTGGILDIFNINIPAGGSFTVPAGAQGAAMTGTASGKLTGYAGEEVLIGNNGNDTIDAAGGNGTIIVGNKNNEIMLNGTQAGGNVTIVAGSGKNHLDMYGGNVSLSGIGTEQVDIHSGSNTLAVGTVPPPNTKLNLSVEGGANTVSATGATGSIVNTGGTNSFALAGSKLTIADNGGSNSYALTGGGTDTFTGGGATVSTADGVYKLTLSGNDSITLGSGNDTITEAGSAMVNGGSGLLSLKGATGNLSVVLGSGNATLLGGSGDDSFTTGAGVSSIKLGGGNNSVSAGAATVPSGGHDGYAVVGSSTMDGSGAASNLFTFGAGIFGSTQTVKHFTHGRDHIHLVGLDTTAPGVVHVSGSTETLSFDGGATKIVLLNINTPLTGSDFI
jgi:hypothetical protein